MKFQDLKALPFNLSAKSTQMLLYDYIYFIEDYICSIETSSDSRFGCYFFFFFLHVDLIFMPQILIFFFSIYLVDHLFY